MKLFPVLASLAVALFVFGCGDQEGDAPSITENTSRIVEQTHQAQDSTRKASNSYQKVELRAGVMNGRGLIRSNPAGIYCGEDSGGRINRDCSENYSPGTVITIKASPISGWALESWSGACNGTGSCRVTIPKASKSKPVVYVHAHFKPSRKFGY